MSLLWSRRRTSWRLSPAAAGCTDKSCVTKSASATNATHVVRTTVTVEDRDYTVALELLDAQGSVVAKTRDGCEICGVADVGGIIETEAATLKTKLDALASGPSTLKLVSDPPTRSSPSMARSWAPRPSKTCRWFRASTSSESRRRATSPSSVR